MSRRTYIASVCKEINFFDHSDGSLVRSWKMPGTFASVEGVDDFEWSIWKRTQHDGDREKQRDSKGSSNRKSLLEEYEKKRHQKMYRPVLDNLKEIGKLYKYTREDGVTNKSELDVIRKEEKKEDEIQPYNNNVEMESMNSINTTLSPLSMNINNNNNNFFSLSEIEENETEPILSSPMFSRAFEFDTVVKNFINEEEEEEERKKKELERKKRRERRRERAKSTRFSSALGFERNGIALSPRNNTQGSKEKEKEEVDVKSTDKNKLSLRDRLNKYNQQQQKQQKHEEKEEEGEEEEEEENEFEKSDPNNNYYVTERSREYTFLPCKNTQVSDTQIAIGDCNGTVFILSLYSNQKYEYDTLEGHSKQITVLESNYDHHHQQQNNLLLSGSYSSQNICLWDLKKKRIVEMFRGSHHSEITDLKFIQNSSLFVSSSSDGVIDLIDMAKKKIIGSFHDINKVPISCISSSPTDHNLFFAGSFDGVVRKYDIRSSSQQQYDVTSRFSDAVTSLADVRNDRILLCGYGNTGKISSIDTRVQNRTLWTTKNEKEEHNIITKIINLSQEQETEKLFSYCGTNGFIHISNASDGKILHSVLEKQPCFGIFTFTENRNDSKIGYDNDNNNNNSYSENLYLLSDYYFNKNNNSEFNEEEFIKSIEPRNVLDGRILKIMGTLKKIKEEKMKLEGLRNQVEKEIGEIRKLFRSELFKKLEEMVVIPVRKKLGLEREKLRGMKDEVYRNLREVKRIANTRFVKRFSSVFRNMTREEMTKLLDEIKVGYEKDVKSWMIEMKSRVMVFTREIQSLMGQRNSIMMSFSRKTDWKLSYTKSEWKKLCSDVDEVREKIGPINKRMILEYEKLVCSRAFQKLWEDRASKKLGWDHEGWTKKVYSCIPLENHDSIVFYIGDVIDGKAYGSGMMFTKVKRSGALKFLRKGRYFTMSYEGEMYNDQKHGKGIEYDNNERILFEGLFRNNERHGKGICYDVTNNKCIEGVWTSGVMSSQTIGVNLKTGGSEGINADEEFRKSFDFVQVHYEEIEDQLIPARELGRGANGVVYKIMVNNRESAAKIMNLNLVDRCSKSKIKHYIRRSLRLCASFDHPNVIKVYGWIVGHASKIGYIMEKCSHSVSEEMFRRGSGGVGDHQKFEEDNFITFKEKLMILYETARGMQYLHGRNIMNRDLKWDNCLIRKGIRKEIVITDFDTAKEDESVWKNSVSNTASAVGTPVFVAPEVLSKKYGLKVDVYSFGIMIHSLIFGLTNPYSETKYCPCGEKLEKMTPYSFPYHIKTCGLRPLIPPTTNIEKYEWIIELMKLCYSTNPLQRPSFNDIVSQIEKRMNNMIEKRIRLIVKGLDPKDHDPETFIITEEDHSNLYNAVTEKILYRWKGHHIVNLFYGRSGKKTKKSEEVEGEIESSETEKPLKNDEEFIRIMTEGNTTTIVVEFEVVPETDKTKMRKEIQEIVEKFESQKIETAQKHRKEMNEMEEKLKRAMEEIERLKVQVSPRVTKKKMSSFGGFGKKKKSRVRNAEDVKMMRLRQRILSDSRKSGGKKPRILEGKRKKNKK